MGLVNSTGGVGYIRASFLAEVIFCLISRICRSGQSGNEGWGVKEAAWQVGGLSP